MTIEKDSHLVSRNLGEFQFFYFEGIFRNRAATCTKKLSFNQIDHPMLVLSGITEANNDEKLTSIVIYGNRVPSNFVRLNKPLLLLK